VSHLRSVSEGDIDKLSGWDLSYEDLQFWAALPKLADLDLKSKFLSWHKEDYVNAFVLVVQGQVVGYGEIWNCEQEVELARLLIDPKYRRKGFGRLLILGLLEKAFGMAPTVWLRVHPNNQAALALYASCGFHVANDAQHAEFNANQPVPYIWMHAD